MRWVILVVILLVMVSLGLVAYFKKKDVVITIQKEKLARRNITEVVIANGKIQPVSQVKISPEVSGEILELPFREGDLVKKGDLLISIRPDNYVATRDSQQANYRYATANQKNAQVNLDKAELEFHRNEELSRNKLISDSDFLTAKTSYDLAKSTLAGVTEQVAMASAALHNAESDLLKTRIYSPLDGKITKLSSQKGERVVGTAMMAGTEIMIVADLAEMEARVDIGENDVVLMAVGEKVKLEVDAFKDRKFMGVVTDVANSAKNNDLSSAMASSASQEATKFQVKIRVREKEKFLPGMSVTAEIETRSVTNAIAVPIQCVTTRLPKDSGSKTNSASGTNQSNGVAATNTVLTNATGITNTPGMTNASGVGHKKGDDAPKPVEVVFVVKNDHVEMHKVKIGISDDTTYEVLEGLAEGDEVVTGPYKAIKDDLDDEKKVMVGGPKVDMAHKPN